MTVDLVGPKGAFGKLNLPEVKTTSKGADVIIKDQKIQITDMEAFLAFNKSLQLDEKLTMHLDNGQGTIKALGMKSKIVYKKPVAMKGMDGPQTEIVKTEVLGDGQFKNTMKIINPSPVEIDLGNVVFAFKNQAGEVLATQIGNVYIKKGETIYEATGEVKQKSELGRVSIVGLSEAKGTWVSKTLEFFNTPLSLTPEMEKLLSA
ncbi:hypothetical protein BT63DRAFT_422491 [Microthyrium microscopicum]|uniref:Uncharacterized protein n=1 Tax=Microthyrium microscopicum TaxID=703497 RepID=A0A6A6ULL8_9PEZI|nr:hypothetical protein BT63DRAFT_422491 [Microthyrium microscopicum]